MKTRLRGVRWASGWIVFTGLGASAAGACSGAGGGAGERVFDTDAEARAAGGGPKVTLRFENPTPHDLYVDDTLGFATKVADADGTWIEPPGFCKPICQESGCACVTCGAALPSVRRIPAGGVYEIAWDANRYESARCKPKAAEGPPCPCAERIPLEHGRYTVFATAARGVKKDEAASALTAGDGGDRFAGTPDATAGTCEARGDVQHDGKDKALVVRFVCP